MHWVLAQDHAQRPNEHHYRCANKYKELHLVVGLFRCAYAVTKLTTPANNAVK